MWSFRMPLPICQISKQHIQTPLASKLRYIPRRSAKQRILHRFNKIDINALYNYNIPSIYTSVHWKYIVTDHKLLTGIFFP